MLYYYYCYPNLPESSGSQEMCRVAIILHIVSSLHTAHCALQGDHYQSYHSGVGHPVINHCVDSHSDGIPGQDLLRWNIKRHGPEVHFLVRINTGDDEEYAWALCTALHQATKAEYHSSLVFLHYLNKQLISEILPSSVPVQYQLSPI